MSYLFSFTSLSISHVSVSNFHINFLRLYDTFQRMRPSPPQDVQLHWQGPEPCMTGGPNLPGNTTAILTRCIVV